MIRPEVVTARRLRSDMPEAERILWSRLRRSALGYKFRRQHPIGPYVTDFCCLPLRVVVEVDGGSHFEDRSAMEYDRIRDRFIRGSGFSIVRVTNTEVRRELDSVCAAIRAACNDAARAQR